MNLITNNKGTSLPIALATLALIAAISAMGMAVNNTYQINQNNKNTNYNVPHGYELSSLIDVDPGLVYTTPNTDIGEANPGSAQRVAEEDYAAINGADFARLEEKYSSFLVKEILQ